MANKITLKAAYDSQLQMTVEPEIAREIVTMINGEKHVHEEGPVTMLFQNPNMTAMLALVRAVKQMAPDTEVEYFLGSYKVTPQLWYKYSGATGDEQNLP